MSSSGVGPTQNRLGRYHLTEPIGGGPTGEVFRAKVYGVAGFERQFAVKRFHPQFVKDPKTAEAVASAARVYGGLEHPRIARLHEYGVTGGHAFTATELVDGLDLARLLSLISARNQRLPRGGIAALVSQIARTLGYAHGRGICHLGICPTNIIVTTDGEAKITDFGFLVARLPRQPGNDPSLRSRLSYLAPEQLGSELTSAATDVFQLGAVAYEMFHDKPAFGGLNSQLIAQAILSGERPRMDLDKPMAKVLERCLSRSPFERYPDARALADGMDAATRGLALAGGLPDIGQAVRDAMEFDQDMDDGEMSGALSFPLPAPPRGDAMMDHVQTSSDDGEELPATTIRGPSAFSDPGLRVPPVPVSLQSSRNASFPTVTAPPLEPSSRPGLAMEPMSGEVDEMDEEMPTVIRERDRGFVRPTPIGLATLDNVDQVAEKLLDEAEESAQESESPASLAPEVPRAATPAPRVATPPPIPPPMGRVPDGQEEPMELSGAHLEIIEEFDAPAAPAPAAEEAPATVPRQADGPTHLAPATPATDDPAPDSEERVERSGPPQTISDVGPRLSVRASDTWDPLTPVPRLGPQEGVAAQRTTPRPGGLLDTAAHSSPTRDAGTAERTDDRATRRGRGALFWIVLMIVLLGLAAGGWFLYTRFLASEATDDGVVPSTLADAASPEAPGDAGDAGDVGDAGVPLANADAGGATDEPADAGSTVASSMPPEQTATDDGKLTIESKPKRAKIYLDGSDIDKTPHTMEATADRHTVALIKPGYKLYTAEINGSGRLSVTLEEATPPDGPAGIKVRCAKKNRYYVFVDGADTGQLCPTERIGVTEGPHTVEIYDPVTETRREFPVTVEGTRRSLRLRVD